MENHLRKAVPKAEIRQRLRQQLPLLAARYGVTSLKLFGSYARDEATPASDVDLLVEIDNPRLTLLQFIELHDYLSDLVGMPVDLVEKETLKPALGERILSEVAAL